MLFDPPQLENALLNLCINARDAMPNGGGSRSRRVTAGLTGGPVRIAASQPRQYVSLCVSETGTGITPDVIAKVFDPFFTTKPIG